MREIPHLYEKKIGSTPCSHNIIILKFYPESVKPDLQLYSLSRKRLYFQRGLPPNVAIFLIGNTYPGHLLLRAA
jgi:hypothetical protein